MWGQRSIVEKKQGIVGGGPHEVGQHFARTKVLVLASGDKHNTIQYRHRNEVEKGTWTVRRDQDHSKSSPKPFPERSRRI